MKIPTAAEALPGRSTPLPTPTTHWVNGNSLKPPFPAGMETAIFGLGCFWGAERKFWQVPGVYSTAVGYAGGPTPNPTYQEVCSGMTGHNEVVLVVFDPQEDQLRRAAEDLLGKPRPDPGHAPGQRCRHAIPLRHLCRIAPSSAAPREASRKPLPARAGQGRLRRDHDRDPRRSAVLLRRGLSPAVSGKEPEWLLRTRRHRGRPAR